MKLSLNWLKKYLNISYPPEKIAEMLTIIGLEVEGIDKVESIKGGMKGIVTGEVVECEKHPDADRLSVTNVNIGNEQILQIVCGAPNVMKGQKVMVATIGTELYKENGEIWSIKKGKIRGVESQGMICAEDELGIGNDHSGIIVLPENTEIGLSGASFYNIEDDHVFEVGLTPNRSDATSQLGIARDLLAYLRVNEAYTDDIIEPDISGFVTERVGLNIDVEVLDHDACIRYTGLTVTNVVIKESPEWLKKLLKSIGVKPINNIVDITNFVLNELGQPLHAFDADKIEGKKVIIKPLEEGTSFITLDGVTRKLSAEDLMICDGNSTGLCMAGVYGGAGSGVTDQTKNIFLESACFNPKSIRKTSTRHNLRTDAAKVFEKGSDPNITEIAIKRAASLIRELANGSISNELIDVYVKEVRPVEIQLYYKNVNALIGTELSEDDIYTILQAMEMEVKPFDDESILVKVPSNKVDVTREVDLIEEIVRIYGFNRVPLPDKIQSTVSYTQKPEGTCVRTDYQTAGKGQIGRYWHSEAGKNVLISYIFYPHGIMATDQFYLNIMSGLAVRNVLSLWIPNVKIKWPNDIYVGNKKIAGILVQNVLRGNQIKATIIGTGINVNQILFPDDIPNPTSVAIETGESADLEKIILWLSAGLEHQYFLLKKQSFGILQMDYLNHFYRLNEWATFCTDTTGDFLARITGIDSQGKLLLQLENDTIVSFGFREVTFKI